MSEFIRYIQYFLKKKLQVKNKETCYPEIMKPK
jgi:hypothetical protein